MNIQKSALKPVVIEFLRSSREELRLAAGPDEELPANAEFLIKEIFSDLEKLMRGEFDKKSCAEFRAQLFGE